MFQIKDNSVLRRPKEILEVNENTQIGKTR